MIVIPDVDIYIS